MYVSVACVCVCVCASVHACIYVCDRARARVACVYVYTSCRRRKKKREAGSHTLVGGEYELARNKINCERNKKDKMKKNRETTKNRSAKGDGRVYVGL